MARPAKYDYEEVERRIAGGKTAYEVALDMKIPVGTLYSHKRMVRKKKAAVRQYILEWQEIHMVGNDVGVAWSTNQEHVRTSEPYIIFCNIALDENGVPRQSEESQVDGGLSLPFAVSLVEQLKDAIKHMEKVK